MGKVQIVICGVGAVLFLWFAAPFAVKGMINIGNITGMAISVLLVLYGLYRKRVHRMLAFLWEKNGGKVVLALTAVLAGMVLITAAVETVLIIRASHNEPPKNTTAVVLGCSVKGSAPSMILEERIRAAYRYLEENPEAKCILSGGQGEGEDISEAACMYRELAEKGIDASRLLLEDSSTTTGENLQYSKQLLEENGLGNEITIVTSEFHEYRANAAAKKLGLVSYSTPSATFFAFLPTYYVRELYGILYYQFGK